MTNLRTGRARLTFIALALSQVVSARAYGFPLCSDELNSTQPVLRDDHLSVAAASHEKFIFRPVSLPSVVIEVRASENKGAGCYVPLSGWSIYWDMAVLAIERERANPSEARPQIFTFEDPGYSQIQQALDAARRSPECLSSDPLDELLVKGFAHLAGRRPKEAAACYTLAMHLSPSSVAANYGAARAAGLERRNADRVLFYERTVQLAPRFYEARIELAYALLAVERPKQAEVILEELSAGTPLPVRKRAYEGLAFLFNREKRREQTVEAKRSYVGVEKQLRGRYAALVGDAVLAFDTKDLAAREEEIGDYRAAYSNFSEAARLAKVSSVSEAVLFQSDLGRLRNAERLGDVETASKGCDQWRKRLNRLGRNIDDGHWGGMKVATAQWEASCGDFPAGVSMLNSEIKRTPASDVPYRALEGVYRSVGKSALADRAEALADRVRTEHDQAVLKGILREAEELAAEGRAIEVKR